MLKGRVVQAAKVGAVAGVAGTGIAAGSAWLTWHRLARRALPKTEGTLAAPGLDAEVTVRRDRWGTPHIQASSVEDGLFGQGFVSAQDRLWAMDFYRRVVSGRLSEFAGEETLKTDRVMRTLGMRHVAEREEKGLGPQLRALLERFCAGVNAGAAAAKAPPFEFRLLGLEWEPWTPVDVLSLGKLLAFGLSTNWERELLRADMVRDLGPELTARLDPTYPRDNPIVDQTAWDGVGLPLVEQIDAVRRSLGLATEASGSNNWAVSGERSATGMPLIAGDPHLPQGMPGLWYEIEVRIDDWFVRGASLPGLPGLYMGQTNDVAWTITNVMSDIQDLFIERVDGDRYLFEDEWRPLVTRTEEIVVKGRERPATLEIRETHHGPIVNEALGADEAEPLALAWQTLREPTAFLGQVDLLQVRS
ncbi:MAG TPA: penicillin acylase family protein, partial [Solirubrobacterales bacterium]|nr:penicillin acylase family protein [Solirubrobacterales bacterium]